MTMALTCICSGWISVYLKVLCENVWCRKPNTVYLLSSVKLHTRSLAHVQMWKMGIKCTSFFLKNCIMGVLYVPLLPLWHFCGTWNVAFPSSMLYGSLYVSACLHDGKRWVNSMVMLLCYTLCIINMYEV